MRPFSKLLSAFVLSAASFFANAAPLEQVQAERLMDASGLTGSLEVMSAAMAKSIAQGVGDGPATPSQLLLAAQYQKVFTPARLQEALRRELKQQLPVEQANAVLRWYESDLGKRVVKLDQDDIRQEETDFTVISKGMEAIAVAGPARGSLYKRYIEVTRQGEMTANLVIRMMSGVAVAAARLQGAASTQAAMDLVRRLESARPAMVGQLNSVLFAKAAVRYEGLTDQEVNDLIRFEESTEEQAFMKVVNEGLGKAMESGLRELVDAIEGQKSQKLNAEQGECSAGDLEA